METREFFQKDLHDIIKVIDDVVNCINTRGDNDDDIVKQLLEVHEKTSVPVVLDTHHFTFNSNDLVFSDAFTQTIQTWGNTKPLQHISNTEVGMESGTFTEKRAHSAYIQYVPPLQLEAARANTIDIDVEAKMKNLALLKMRKDYDIAV